jgi:integrase
MRLTDKGLQNLTSDRPRDILAAGRRGLIVRIAPARGVVRKVFRYRWMRGGRRSLVRLGEYGDTFRLTDAFALHALCCQAADTGGDPRAVVDAWWRQHAPAPPDAAGGPTVADVVTEFLTWAERNRRRPEQAKQLLDANVIPYLGKRAAASVRKRDIVLTLDRIVRRGSPVQANRVRAVLKQAFAIAADRDLIETVPPFPREAPGGKESPRERVLTDDEVVLLWHGLDVLTPAGRRGKGISRPLALSLKLLLVTGQRRGEIAAARWSDIHVGKPAEGQKPPQTWHIPVSKNDRPHDVPLSSLAVKLLEELRTHTGNSEFWLPSARSDKAADDRDRTITKAAREVRELLRIADWTPHDLRRTARTGLSRLGVSEAVAERVVNHVSGDRMVQVYNRHTYQQEMRDALNQWGAHIEGLIAQPFTLPDELKHLVRGAPR